MGGFKYTKENNRRGGIRAKTKEPQKHYERSKVSLGCNERGQQEK